MIVTVTLNPSLDRTVEVAALATGELVRAASSQVDPGGKGVNVARALAAHKIPTCAVVPLGGPEGKRLADLLGREGVDVRPVPVIGHTRSNLSLVEPDGVVTKINEPGGALNRDDLYAVVAAVRAAARGAEWVVASGSLPPGVPSTFYAELGKVVAKQGVRFAVDTSGEALSASLPARPALLKPNRRELAEAVGWAVDTVGDAIDAAETLHDAGAGAVLASLGAAGAVLVSAEGIWSGESLVGGARSAVGAGDAMLAGFLAAGGHGREGLVEALAWGAAAVRFTGSRMPGPEDVDRAAVRLDDEPDCARWLDELREPTMWSGVDDHDCL